MARPRVVVVAHPRKEIDLHMLAGALLLWATDMTTTNTPSSTGERSIRPTRRSRRRPTGNRHAESSSSGQ